MLHFHDSEKTKIKTPWYYRANTYVVSLDGEVMKSLGDYHRCENSAVVAHVVTLQRADGATTEEMTRCKAKEGTLFAALTSANFNTARPAFIGFLAKRAFEKQQAKFSR